MSKTGPLVELVGWWGLYSHRARGCGGSWGQEVGEMKGGHLKEVIQEGFLGWGILEYSKVGGCPGMREGRVGLQTVARTSRVFLKVLLSEPLGFL